MPRLKGQRTGRCTICGAVERVRMEHALAGGATLRGVAAKFGVQYYALRRHWIGHVSPEAKAEYVAGAGASKDQLEAIIADESVGYLDHYRIIRSRLYKLFDAAALVGDRLNVDRLAGRIHENLRDCARLTGDLQKGPLLNVNISADGAGGIQAHPDFIRAAAVIVQAVAPFPDAREAILRALRELDEAPVPPMLIASGAAE